MLNRSLRYMLWLTSALALAGYLHLTLPALFRAPSADPLDATVIENATRIAKHQPAFLEPAGGGAIPLMPGFPFAVSGLVLLFDPQAWEPRLLSLLATLLAASIVGLVVRFETGSVTLGVAGAGFLMLGQVLGGRSPFASGPEALSLLLVLAGCMLLRYAPAMFGALSAALVFAACCFTHVSGLWFAFAALFHLAVHDRQRLVPFAIALAVLVGGGHVALSHALGPWFNYQAWDLPLRAMRFAPNTLLGYVGTQLLGTLGVLSLGTVLSFALPIPPWRGSVGIWTWMGFAALGAGMISTQSSISAVDALRPAMIALAIIGPISIQRVTHHLSAWPGSSRLGGQGVVLTALALQFLMLLSRLTRARLGFGV